MQPIPLASLLPAGFDPTVCKLHCAVFNGENYPIDVLANDPAEWQRWNSWRGDKNDFNRQFIFALAQDRHDPNLWLFGGTWEVTGRRPEPRTYSYDVVPREDLLGPFIRRLYIRLHLAGRQRRRTMESCLDEMTVSSILDQTTGARYVGSAYGDTGIWQRWSTYAATLHGSNIGLQELLDEKGKDYFCVNMKFALLEFWSMRTDDSHVLERESYWKEVLNARSLGHNKN